MFLKNLVKCVAGIILTIGITLPAFAKPEVVLRVHHFLPPPSTGHKMILVPWAEKVKKDSNGRIDVKIFPAMQLGGKPPQLYNQVRDGVVDVVWTLPGYSAGKFLLTGVFELPFIPADAVSTSKALQEFYEKHLKNEYKDVHPLFFHVHAPGSIHTNKLISKMSDFRGMKLRAPNRSIGNALKELGATPVFMPVPAVPEALSKGVVDGAVLPFEVTLPLKVHELVHNHSEIKSRFGLYTATFGVFMNKRKYESLPADLKKVIDKNSGMEWAIIAGKAFSVRESPGIEKAKSVGNQFATISDAEINRWSKEVQPVVKKWLKKVSRKGMDGKMLLSEAKSLIEKHRTN